MRLIFTKLIRFYQLFISSLFPATCRYYPTCSEYSLWQFKHNNFFKAFFAMIVRILKCNPFSHGGIDYPIVKKNITFQNSIKNCKFEKPKFWFIPFKDGYYYIIKQKEN